MVTINLENKVQLLGNEQIRFMEQEQSKGGLGEENIRFLFEYHDEKVYAFKLEIFTTFFRRTGGSILWRRHRNGRRNRSRAAVPSRD